jgi:hypothetical protein
MQDVVDKAAIDRAIDTMNPVDPMSYKPVLTTYRALQHTNAGIKRVILRPTNTPTDMPTNTRTDSFINLTHAMLVAIALV